MRYLIIVFFFAISINIFGGHGIVRKGNHYGIKKIYRTEVQYGFIIKYDPNAINFFRYTTLDYNQRYFVNKLVKDLKAINSQQTDFVNFTTNSSSIIQALYLPVGDQNSRIINLIDPAKFQASFSGNYTLDQQGMYGDGTTGYFNTNYTPSGNQQLNSAHFLIWNSYDSYESKYIGSNDVPYGRMCPRWVDNKFYGTLNGGAEKAVDSYSSQGLMGLIRNTSGHLIFAQNSQLADVTVNASALSYTPYRVMGCGGTSTSYSYRQNGLISLGLGISNSAYPLYYNAITNFLKGVEAYSIDSTNYIMMHTPTHVRHDASSQRKLPNGNILCVWGYSDALSEDGSPSVIKGKLSADNGITWGSEYLIASVNGSIGSYCPSLEIRNDGTIVLILLVQNSATTSELYQCESADNGATFNTPYKIYGEANSYYSPISDRIFITNTGRWLYPFNLNTNGILSSGGGTYVGKLLYSDNEGLSWNLSSLTVNGITANYIDLLVVESGIYQLPSNKLVFYSRTRNGYVNMSESNDNGQTWGTPYSSTLSATNATATIKYINRLNALIAVRNRNTGTINGNAGRKIMDILKSTDEGQTWTIIKTITQVPGIIYFEPTILELTNKIIVFYSKSDFASSLNVDLIYTILDI